MIPRRHVLAAALGLVMAPAVARAAAAAASSPVATIQSFYDVLLGVMKQASALGFAGRRDRLAPVIRQSFDLPLMTRLMVGPRWRNLTPTQQQQLVKAFENFSIATYANRFDGYSGERFQVDPKPAPAPNGGVLVRTKLVKSNGEPVEIDYLMHEEGGNWQIVDVYLNGTVSELATRRSEFSSVLRRGGPEALVDLLQRKTAQLSG